MNKKLALIGGVLSAKFDRTFNRVYDQSSLKGFVIFIGFARSGSTLAGSIVNAHPDALVSVELNVMRYLLPVVSRTHLYSLIARNEKHFTEAGNEWTDYSYDISGASQGKVRDLRIIGDKKAAATTKLLAERPELLDRLSLLTGLPVKVVHVVRNPFDVIATQRKRGSRELDYSVDNYVGRVMQLNQVVSRIPSEDLLSLKHDKLLSESSETIRNLFEFLELSCEDSVVNACASVIDAKPNKSRLEADWSTENLAKIERVIDQIQFLDGYSFE